MYHGILLIKLLQTVCGLHTGWPADWRRYVLIFILISFPLRFH